ncbi:tyrosine-type recombinase/integrase [Bacillus sp. PS06]|uniref:tyrosine-type recombinase/integrase n=1 Tax=Bacillus sp. PS06 TaxID=2764176 RepID=UPI00177C180C|nr:tyrosine-type recombinase/integrase [Bacillus sp. PS06]MBD8069234.1 tyrosine-type recombinase/integrase [Bacillus sp. PS06]
MEFVDALKDINQINKIKGHLWKQSKRDYLLFVLGINTGLKISELLSIKVSDLLDADGKMKPFLEVTSTIQPSIPIFLNSQVEKAIRSYAPTSNLHFDDYLFLSSKSNKPITRQQAYRIINKAAKLCDIPGSIGTHSLRKTFGYHAYKKGVAISILQKMFHHSSSTETLKYLGIDKTNKIKTEIDVNL